MAVPIAVLDCDLLLHGRGLHSLERFSLETVSEDFLLAHFGFPRHFILYLVELLREGFCRKTQRSRAISPEVQVLAALGFYTSGSFQTSMGDSMGISQASMSRCVSNVTRALVDRAPHFISFCRDAASRERSSQDFQRVAGFPGVLGVLDCVQVAIKAPHSETWAYLNRKGLHCVSCQLVCDSRGLLLSAETHWPGSLQAPEVLERSSLSTELQGACEGWLLGDARYPARKWLMTPLERPESPAELQYNLAHAATHEIVDRTFRAIQTRFRCLDGTKGALQYSPERSSSILLACCVLHNASLQAGLDAWTLERLEPVELVEPVEPAQREGPQRGGRGPDDQGPSGQAEQLREQLVLQHFS